MYRTRVRFLIVVVTLLALFVAACGGDKEAVATPVVAATAVPAPDQEQPAAGEATNSPLATPVADSPIQTPTPESSGEVGETSADTGAITGKILITRDGVDVPVGNMIIGLAQVIRDENGQPAASGYAADSAKKGTTNGDGAFAVNDVPPGTYSLILDAVITSYQLEDPESSETILVDVEAGKVVDIGVLRYDSLPVPGFAAP